MVLLLAVILIILGLLVFALKGIFGVFPDKWEWVGIVIAGVGLLMGVPSILQMCMGKPKLLVEFDDIVKEKERNLAIFLKNEQLGNPLEGKKSFWRKIGVKRDTIESLIVSLRILNAGTRDILIPIMQSRIFSDADPTSLGTWRTTLPPTLSFETCVMIAMWDESKKRAIVPGDQRKPHEELAKGIYEIIVTVVTDGEPQFYSRQFIVGDTADDLTWVKPVPHKKGFRIQ